MKITAWISCLLLSSITMVFAQDGSNQHMITDYFDPSFPDKNQTHEIYQAAMKHYIADGYYYPIEIINQRRQSDNAKLQVSAEFENELELWYEQHPFFPQPFSTGNPVEDKRMFLKARAMWIKYNPDEYVQLKQLIKSDDYLRKKYAFVIEL